MSRMNSQRLAAASLVLAVVGWLIVMTGGLVVAGMAGAFSPTGPSGTPKASLAAWQPLISGLGILAIIAELAAIAVVQYSHRRFGARERRDRIASWIAYVFFAAMALTIVPRLML